MVPLLLIQEEVKEEGAKKEEAARQGLHQRMAMNYGGGRVMASGHRCLKISSQTESSQEHQ